MFEAWEEDAAERERGRKALEIVDGYAQHLPGCEKSRFPLDRKACTCGLHEAVLTLDTEAPPAPFAAASKKARTQGGS